MTNSPSWLNRPFFLGSILVACGMLITLFFGLGKSEPQLVADEEVFRTVDALFTALTSRDSHRVDDCDRRLEDLYADNRLSNEVADLLDSVIEKSRNGEWESAAQRLYNLMLAQQRK